MRIIIYLGKSNITGEHSCQSVNKYKYLHSLNNLPDNGFQFKYNFCCCFKFIMIVNVWLEMKVIADIYHSFRWRTLLSLAKLPCSQIFFTHKVDKFPQQYFNFKYIIITLWSTRTIKTYPYLHYKDTPKGKKIRKRDHYLTKDIYVKTQTTFTFTVKSM